ncbi:MAG: methyl-accepting chemotaxis protein [Methylococcaceae bacterium]|nr:MAG: methyl-accepting chemotaxis protein [Methylococcaceae bacterium]
MLESVVLNNMKISIKLLLLMGLMALLLIGIGVSGLMSMAVSNASLETVYSDRVVPLRDLKIIADMYAVNIVDTSHKVRNGNLTWAEARTAVDDAEQTIAQKWQAYTSTSMTSAEQKIIEEIEPMMKSNQVYLNQLKTILQHENKDEISSFTINQLYQVIDPIGAKFAELINIQIAAAKQEYDIATERYQTTRMWRIAIISLGLLFGFILAYWIIRSVTQPIKLMQTVLAEIERTGDFSKQVAYQSTDEVGQTALAFNSMMTTLQHVLEDTNKVMNAMKQGDFSQRINVQATGDLALLKDTVDKVMQGTQNMLDDIGHVMSNVAMGDLTQRVHTEGYGDLLRLKDNINKSLESLSNSMQTINVNTRQVAAAASESSAAIGQISDGAQNQMHAINQVASAVRQTASSVSDVASNTEAASKKSQESVAIVRNGKIKMEHMVDVVNKLAANSEKINKITEVIEKIANKTNLLSLNAAIEAARAGEHGKGFAVVAEEVGKLAANSAESTQEIALLVQQAVSETNRAVATVQEVSNDMSLIEAGSVQADAMLQRISAALEEQSAAVHEINANVANLNKIAENNATASEEITATVVDLSRIADNTRREVERFKI